MLQSWEFLEYRQEISISNEDRIVNPPMKNNLYRAAFSLKQAFRPGDLWREPGLWGIVFMQILVNLFWFSHNTLWVDEAYSALLARRSLGAIHQALRLDAGPPLYYDLLHFWRSLFGESPTALRSMSLFFAVIATVGLYGFVRTGWNRKTGILVAGLFAFSPLTIEYIHEVRNYTLLAAECIGFSWALYAYVLEGKKLALWLCGLCVLAMVYTHNV